MTKRKMGDWDMRPDALPKRIMDKLDELVELWDIHHANPFGWDREAVIETLLVFALKEIVCKDADTPMTLEVRHEQNQRS